MDSQRLLWIAFKSLYLWYSKQPRLEQIHTTHSCELLSKVYIFDIRNNLKSDRNTLNKLWIAFKSLYLWYSKQLYNNIIPERVRCELLSKVYIFDIRNNKCLALIRIGKLWIAFKSLYLWYSKQRADLTTQQQVRCELLSKVYIFDIRNNAGCLKVLTGYVVNCFQKFISLIFETTTLNWWMRTKCCELLSKVYIFDIRNNTRIYRRVCKWLWIAFKSLYLWYSKQPN